MNVNNARIARGLKILNELLASVALGQPADQFLANYFRQNRGCGSKDRRFYRELSFSYFRWQGWIARLSDPETAACFALAIDGHDLPPWQTEWIEATIPALKDSPFPKHSTLQKKLDHFNALTLLHAELTDLLPEWMTADLPAEIDLPELIATFQERPPSWLRIPASKRSKLTAMLEADNGEVELHKTMHETLAIHSNFQIQNIHRRFPKAEVQDLASQVVGLVCRPAPGEHWLDLCAGSGGKTLPLAQKVGRHGKVTASDTRPDALERLAIRAERSKLNNIICTPVKKLNPVKFYDGILVDAPCTGTGTWARNPDARLRTTAADLERLTETQAKLLDRAVALLKPGGRLVYATCSLCKSEGPIQIEQLRERHADLKPLETIDPLTNVLCSGRFILPKEGPCNGMFYAILQKDEDEEWSEES